MYFKSESLVISRQRRGFTMITILWVMTVASIMVTAAELAGRNAVNAARNRTQLERAFWIAAGCGARARAAIDEALGETASAEAAADAWRVVGRSSGLVTQSSECDVVLEASGTRLDVNAASEEMITALLRGIGYGDKVPGMVDALSDWRDSDEVARPAGAEADWYVANVREPPRNAGLRDIRELARVRGFENISAFDTVMTTEPGRVSLATAPVSVLIAVPGITRETAEKIVALQEAGTPIRDPALLAGMISRISGDSLSARFPDVVRSTTPDPDAWILTVRAHSGFPVITAAFRWRLIRQGKRCLVVRTWPLQ